jgi:hypothetical protein
MFAKEMLIQSVIRVEDSVKIVVTEILASYLDTYFDIDNSDTSKLQEKSQIDKILFNLTETLKLTDDVEGSVIYVFDLINQILNHQHFDPSKTTFTFDQDVFYPFNFHRVVKVRKTFNMLINKFLKSAPGFIKYDNLKTLHTLTIQSMIMEEDAELR